MRVFLAIAVTAVLTWCVAITVTRSDTAKTLNDGYYQGVNDLTIAAVEALGGQAGERVKLLSVDLLLARTPERVKRPGRPGTALR